MAENKDMRVYVDSEKRLRRADDLRVVAARDVLADAVRNRCPFHLELGKVKAEDRRRFYGGPDYEFQQWEGEILVRLSIPNTVHEGTQIRFVADTTYGNFFDMATTNRHQIESMLNDLEPISTFGGCTVEGERYSTGSVYRVIFNELGTAPSLRWMTKGGATSIVACETEEASQGSAGNWVYDVWLPDTPRAEWYAAETTAPDAVEVVPIGPGFAGSGVQIDRLVFHPTASGSILLQVTGDSPTDPIPVDASAEDILAEVRSVSPGVYSSARRAGEFEIDLIHGTTGVQTPITADDIYASVADIRAVTIAHSDLVADRHIAGSPPVLLEIINERVTETDGLSATTSETIYSAEL